MSPQDFYAALLADFLPILGKQESSPLFWSFGAMMFFNPKGRYFRAASGVLSGIGVVNMLPTGNINPQLYPFFVLLNIVLIGLAGLLFWLDYKENQS
ncbi:MAG: hypothetical protein ACTFAK_00370 [Candidatus Electronema sp. VV]